MLNATDPLTFQLGFLLVARIMTRGVALFLLNQSKQADPSGSAVYDRAIDFLTNTPERSWNPVAVAPGLLDFI